MNKVKLIILFIIIIFKSVAFAQNQTYLDVADTLQNWIEKRIINAQKGINEKIEMPFVVRTSGWGCKCPDYYIGISPDMKEGPWIEPIIPKNFPVSDTLGYSLIVTGYFTGKWIEKDYRNHNGEPNEWLYKIPEFTILTWKKNNLGYDTTPPKIID